VKTRSPSIEDSHHDFLVTGAFSFLQSQQECVAIVAQFPPSMGSQPKEQSSFAPDKLA
jgi:hypothetical protein